MIDLRVTPSGARSSTILACTAAVGTVVLQFIFLSSFKPFIDWQVPFLCPITHPGMLT